MIYLIDGPSQFYRAIHTKGADLRSPSGEPTRGTYYFVRMLLKLVRERTPSHLAIALDDAREKLWRREWYPPYKADRSPKDREVVVQVWRIRQIIDQLGIPTILAPGWEADDVLASFTRKYRKKRMVLVSRDKDLHQLVSDRVSIYDPQADEDLDVLAVVEKWGGITPDRIPDVQALMGDSTDNVPGVPGIGPKRAKKLIREYGDLATMRAEGFEDVPPKLQDALIETDLDLMKKLVTLNDRLPVPPLTEIRFRELSFDKARKMFRELGFKRWS